MMVCHDKNSGDIIQQVFSFVDAFPTKQQITADSKQPCFLLLQMWRSSWESGEYLSQVVERSAILRPRKTNKRTFLWQEAASSRLRSTRSDWTPSTNSLQRWKSITRLKTCSHLLTTKTCSSTQLGRSSTPSLSRSVKTSTTAKIQPTRLSCWERLTFYKARANDRIEWSTCPHEWDLRRNMQAISSSHSRCGLRDHPCKAWNFLKIKISCIYTYSNPYQMSFTSGSSSPDSSSSSPSSDSSSTNPFSRSFMNLVTVFLPTASVFSSINSFSFWF